MCDQRNCCPTEVLAVVSDSDYKHGGCCVTVNGFDMFVFGGEAAKEREIIVVAYDIFGLHSNVFQLCDRLESAGFCVVLPDFFRGKPWPLNEPIDREALMKWISEAGSWEVVLNDVNAMFDYLKENGYSTNKVGFVGFCWGGKQAFRLAADPRFAACATAHPSFLTEEDAQNAKVPLAVLLSKDEPDLESVKKILLAKPFGDRCVWDRFDNMHHGWCTARGDWSNEVQAARASEALNIFANFFRQELK